MRHIDRLKLVFAVIGLAAFFMSVRLSSPALRWTGIGFVAAAWGLRFMRRPSREEDH